MPEVTTSIHLNTLASYSLEAQISDNKFKDICDRNCILKYQFLFMKYKIFIFNKYFNINILFTLNVITKLS